MRLTILTTLTLLLNLPIFSQPEQQNLLKLGLISPFISTLDLSYERVITGTYFTAQTSISRTYLEGVIEENALIPKLSGFSTEIQLRKYFDRLLGIEYFYSGVSFSYAQYNLSLASKGKTVDLIRGDSKFLGIIILGLQKELAKSLFIDFTIGGGYHFANYTGIPDEAGKLFKILSTSGVLPKLELKVSYGF